MKSKVPYDQVESWLTRLSEWKSRLETLLAQLHHIPGLTQQYEWLNAQRNGHIQETVLNEVIRRIRVKEVEIPLLQVRIQVLETAIQGLRKEEQEFVEYRYLKAMPTLVVADKLGMTTRSLFRLRRRTLAHLYRIVGGEDSILGLSEELLLDEEKNRRGVDVDEHSNCSL